MIGWLFCLCFFDHSAREKTFQIFRGVSSYLALFQAIDEKLELAGLDQRQRPTREFQFATRWNSLDQAAQEHRQSIASDPERSGGAVSAKPKPKKRKGINLLGKKYYIEDDDESSSEFDDDDEDDDEDDNEEEEEENKVVTYVVEW